MASSQIVIDLLSPNPNSPSYCVITHTVSPDPAVAPRMAWSPADGDYSWPPKNHPFVVNEPVLQVTRRSLFTAEHFLSQGDQWTV